jgi:hypothetical protein
MAAPEKGGTVNFHPVQINVLGKIFLKFGFMNAHMGEGSRGSCQFLV